MVRCRLRRPPCSGVVTDPSGAVVVGTRVVLRDVATRQEVAGQTGEDGRYTVETALPGRIWSAPRAKALRKPCETVIVERADQTLDVPLRLERWVAVVCRRGHRLASRARPAADSAPCRHHHEDGAIEQTKPLSTGDALTLAANITPVGNGPFGVRPRLRGLDSTRLLVLVDGERLNTARQATDRTGAEVGLVSPDSIARMEMVNGAGTLMYGSDALAGTINIITNEPTFTPRGSGCTASTASTAATRTARRGTGRGRHGAALSPCASRPAPRTSTTIGPASSTSEDTRPFLRLWHA